MLLEFLNRWDEKIYIDPNKVSAINAARSPDKSCILVETQWISVMGSPETILKRIKNPLGKA